MQDPLILKGLVCGGVSQSDFVETVFTNDAQLEFLSLYGVFVVCGDWSKGLSAGDSDHKVVTVGDTVVALRSKSFAVASV